MAPWRRRPGDTVENNNSFYRLPPEQTFAAWRDRTPDNFVMAVKASRYLTRIRRLRDPAEPAARRAGRTVTRTPAVDEVRVTAAIPSC